MGGDLPHSQLAVLFSLAFFVELLTPFPPVQHHHQQRETERLVLVFVLLLLYLT